MMKKEIIGKFRMLCVAWLMLGSNIFAQSGKMLSLGNQAIFKVSKAEKPIIIDGKMDEPAWGKCDSSTFNYFYRLEQPDDQQKTLFRMLWDDENLYLFFTCEDKFITARETNRDGQPYLDDCAEIFLIPVPDSLDMHLGFEVNLYKASNDFIYLNNFYHGENGMVKSFNPDFNMEISINGTVNNNSDIDKGWTMEMAIPLRIFEGLDNFYPVKEGSKWAFLAARQDRNDAEGNRRSTSSIFPVYDIGKSLHQPNRFGLLQFVF